MIFSQNIIVLTLSRKKIIVSKVHTAQKKVVELSATEWNQKILQENIEALVAKVAPQQIRVLLSSDISYVVEGKVPTKVKSITQRSQIKELVVATIPEQVEEESWDYKIVTNKKTGDKKYIAFAPVLSVYNPVVRALQEKGFTFETIEPEELAKKRDENATIGLALKKDIGGKDADQLSIKPKQDSDEKKSPKVMLLIGIVVVLVGIIVTAVTVIIFSGMKTQTSTNEPVVEQASLEDMLIELDQASKTSESTAEIVSASESAVTADTLSEYSVAILNGSGEPGIATEIATQVKTLGFSDIETGNADAYSYNGISISFKEGLTKSDEVLELITQAFFEYDVTEESNLDSDSQFDIEIIVGTK